MKVYDKNGNLLISSGGGGEGGGSKIIDADGDTWVDVEKNADEDRVRMGVKDVEAFVLKSDGKLDLAKQSRARACRNSTQSIPNSTFTKVQLNVEDYDEHNEFDSTTNYRFTAGQAGYYGAFANAGINDLGDGKKVICSITKNGVVVARGRATVGGADLVGQSAATVIYLAASDYLELTIYHNHGSARDLSPYDGVNQLAVHKLS